ncbi:sulfotransferase 1C2 isoform X2 [Xyrichtys novacula]|uniref:Sulfotransferase n=1 Tax=Xyrichtys novacula TaxID=13765 RepID=A0AAV1H6X2_XYRNO|nr:sulfotransferase 1C2 isoform X2 [Xyrichtys novacula]
MSQEGEITYGEAIEKASASIHRFPLIPIRGIPLMNYIAQNWDSIWAFCPDPSDLLIATYPKAGTTWTQEIVDLLLHNGDAEACRRAPTPVRSPFLEIFSPPPIPSGLDFLNKMPPPRVIKTHLPFQLVPLGFWENKCKTIYVARNAKDNMVSYFHFDCMNLTQPEPGPWEGYIHKFMRGELSWGSWYDHVKGYWAEREKRNILYLFYEDMKENPRREVVRIMKYLDLSLSDDVIDRIVELTSFKKMKENPMANYTFIPTPVFDQSISAFMRKGEVGDWMNHFTAEQSKMFDEDYEKQMKEANIPFRTNI